MLTSFDRAKLHLFNAIPNQQEWMSTDFQTDLNISIRAILFGKRV